ncbi:MAG: response regulator [Arcobacter sp.]|nr:MAG: response regulator [Arcobacter sp.]
MANPLVMFIDDSETALASTRMTVTSMPIEVKQYLEAQLCLNDVKAGIVPDLIITDLNMPVMNGLELLKELRALPATKRTPVLMLTTETKDELKTQGKALGLTGWIVKPFNPTQLKSAITRVLRLPA